MIRYVKVLDGISISGSVSVANRFAQICIPEATSCYCGIPVALILVVLSVAYVHTDIVHTTVVYNSCLFMFIQQFCGPNSCNYSTLLGPTKAPEVPTPALETPAPASVSPDVFPSSTASLRSWARCCRSSSLAPPQRGIWMMVMRIILKYTR